MIRLPMIRLQGSPRRHVSGREAHASTSGGGRAMNPAMHALSLYLDTSVIGGYYDAEFMADTRALWRLRDAGRFRFVTSQLVFQEIAGAPERVRELMRSTFAPDDVLERTVEAEELAQAYLAQKIVPPAFEDDARHVAVCTVARLEYLVSWNFKHLANVRRESGFNAVNLLQGHPTLRIVAPTSLIHGYDEKDL
jgi:predicted nucleic acid-binding protein